ncbi:MAG: glycosyltransferase [Bacteriovoracaceae bacterium]
MSKVVIATDFLFERNDSTLYLDLLVSMYPDASLMTLSFQEGKILGEIEHRKIQASFLSHKIKEKKDIGKYLYLIPNAVKSMKVPADTDLLITLSAGYIHGLDVPLTTKHLCYFYEESKPELTLLNKLFYPFVKSFQKGRLSVLSHLYRVVKEDQYNSIQPCFKTSDFPLVTSPDFNYDYYVVEGDNTPYLLLKNILTVLKKLKVIVKIVGDNPALNKLKKEFSDPAYFEFWGKRCNGDLSVLLQGCRAHIDATIGVFPHKTFAALASGRPVLVTHTPVTEEYLTDKQAKFFDAFQMAQLEVRVKEMEADYRYMDSKELRRFALHFNERKFKGDMAREARKLVPTLREEA